MQNKFPRNANLQQNTVVVKIFYADFPPDQSPQGRRHKELQNIEPIKNIVKIIKVI